MSTKENINNTISRDEILKDIKFRLADVSDTKEILDIYPTLPEPQEMPLILQLPLNTIFLQLKNLGEELNIFH